MKAGSSLLLQLFVWAVTRSHVFAVRYVGLHAPQLAAMTVPRLAVCHDLVIVKP